MNPNDYYFVEEKYDNNIDFIQFESEYNDKIIVLEKENKKLEDQYLRRFSKIKSMLEEPNMKELERIYAKTIQEIYPVGIISTEIQDTDDYNTSVMKIILKYRMEINHLRNEITSLNAKMSINSSLIREYKNEKIKQFFLHL